MAEKSPVEVPLYLNRELSWMEFNQRVLNEAMDASVPLLERVKFLAITSSNLDEFFEVRVAGLKQQLESGVWQREADGYTPPELFKALSRRIHRFVEEQYRCWNQVLRPALAERGIRLLEAKDLSRADVAFLEGFYRKYARPVLTPMGIDPTHPFPLVLNKSLNLIVRLAVQGPGKRRQIRLAIVQVPQNLPRLLRLPREDGRRDYILQSHVIGLFLGDLFAGSKILGHWLFRVTRNSELYIDEEDVSNLLEAVAEELHRRRRGDAVRLAVQHDCPEDIRQELLQHLNLSEEDLYLINGPMNPVRLMALLEGEHSPELRDPPFTPRVAPALRGRSDLFAVIRRQDVLLHHPYESFQSVVDFLQQAAEDPQVLAIKQTLYRTGGDPRIVGALRQAVRNGKQVTAGVELKARFDEANNIEWARQLEEAGVHVVYGLVGYKIHAKVTLVVRNEEEGIRRYLHLSTGNYNPTTARLYTDVGFFTCREDFVEDATNFFNLLTGVCQYLPMKKLVLAPFELHGRVVALIRREAENARRGLPARIIAKMNALVDKEVIDALYEASQAGVEVELIVRGICCLRPGLPGISERIRVRSIVDRFLEHSRVFYFENACQPEVYLSSADWMPRNFYKRIEVMWPVEDGNLRERIIQEILALPLRDNVKASVLLPDGQYQRASRAPGEAAHRSQMEFIERATEAEKQAAAPPRVKSKYPKVQVRLRPEGP
ncbi:MAG: polyphosphate kinase 1 [Verrucomicrobiae bacterium]|nr:polyphosphate kinase 1 [Verrucomicrobiae bacterium]